MEKRKRKLGDRSDGWRLHGLDPYDTVSPYIMVERCDAQNFFNDKFEITKVEEYVREKRAQGLKNFGIMHVILAAYVRMLSQKPYVNRFLSGQRVYARNSIQINMAVKRELSANETNTVIKVFFEPTDTAEDVYNKFTKTYEDAFADGENDFDGTARIINYIPGVIKKFAVWFLKLLDYFGLLPKALLNVSPFHGSMFITSMGSLGIPPIYHHLYNFGNVPVFIAFGAKRHAYELNEEGEVLKKRYIDYTVVTDERICDGFSYASAFKTFRRYLSTPKLLDTPPETVVPDTDIDKKPKKKKEKK
ncbi:MAG: hypothetical protein IJO00_00050 [Clostridia bacterium]|nr:hypothetical protein [Clostridia bacterium]